MPLLLQNTKAICGNMLAPAPGADARVAGSRRSPDGVTEIGFINNMPDSAFVAAERQFMQLLTAAAGDKAFRLHRFVLPSIMRSPASALRIETEYTDIVELGEMTLDGLIVTGAEPRTAVLPDEVYWGELSEIIDWAEGNTRSAIWSCLAAHAAVFHLTKTRRHRLQQKRSGIFECAKLTDHWLVEGERATLRVPHARLNELRENELVEQGYEIVTRSNEAGVDMFVKKLRSEFVFFQGHPEYDTNSIQREYVRDITRYLAREQADCPPMPVHYFDSATEIAMRAFEDRARVHRDPQMMSQLPAATLRPSAISDVRSTTATIFRNWFHRLSFSRATDRRPEWAHGSGSPKQWLSANTLVG